MKSDPEKMKMFDAATALAQASGNEQLARDLFTMLLKELPEHNTQISQALDHYLTDPSNERILWEPVHKLHGATAYLGVPALRHYCLELENGIKQQTIEEIKITVSLLLQESARLMEAGNDILNQNWQ